MLRKLLSIVLLSIIFLPQAFAIDGFSLGFGMGEPDELRGGRAALIWDWDKPLLHGQNWAFGGYWDTSYAYWHTQGDPDTGEHKSLSAFAGAPMFRWKTIRSPIHDSTLNFYVEGGVGVAFLTDDHLGHRDLGDNFNFEDRIGTGIIFGERQQYSLGYDFLHYSNARLFPPNQGIDVKAFINFAYRFA